MKTASKYSKRAALKKLSSILTLLFVPKASAIGILEEMLPGAPNKFQSDMIKNPQKQILIAEVAECVSQPALPHALKVKCISGDT